jgi:hypothetical protein
MSFETMSQSVPAPSLGPNFAAPTFYDILNVDKSATRFAIRESYLRLKSLYTTGGDALYGVAAADDLNRHLHDLERAFDVLNDDTRRANYDRELGVSNFTSSTPVAPTQKRHDEIENGALQSMAEVVQTSRSVLKVTRIQANGSGDDNLQAKMLGIIEDSDVGDGSILIALRETAGVTHQEIQERTKISLDYIRSLEGNQFDRLPRVVYVKGFLRSYLRYLNVPDADKIVSSYVARLEAYQAGQK